MPSTVYLVTPLTSACKEWINENVGGETTWYASGLAIEWRYLDNLLLGMENDGLACGVDFTVNN